MATVSKYGLLGEEEPTGGQGTTGAANVSGVTQNPGANAANLNPFGQPRTITPLGAAPVVPQAQQFAFNANYAAQNQALEQMLADRGLERQNQYAAVDADWTRAKGDAERGKAKALEQLINKYASSGILGSGIDAMSRGEMEGNYQRFLGDLDLNRANARQGIEGAWANTIRDVNNQRSGMWGKQQAEEEAARQQAARDQAAAQQAEADRQNQLRIAQEARAAQEAAAASQPSPWTPPYAPGAGGGGGGAYGGGGGGGGLGWNMPYAGIGAGDTMQDVQNQINLLATTGGVHQLSLMYSAPEFQTPEMAGMKKAVGQFVNRMSTPGDPLYNPANSTYQQPGGFY